MLFRSPLQTGLLFHALLAEQSVDQYTVQLALDVRGADPERIWRAGQALIDRHPNLRTSFIADIDGVTPARLRQMVAAARTRLADFERLADEQEARDTLAALLDQHGLRVEEWDTGSLDPSMRSHIKAVHDPTVGDGRTIVVPAGQDPIARLAAVRSLIDDMRGAA